MDESHASGPQGPSELKLRVLSAIVMAAAALLTAWTGGWPLVVLWLLAAIAVAYEWIAMTASAPRQPLFLASAAGIALILAAFLFGTSLWIAGAVALAALAVAALAAGTRDRLWALAGLAYATTIAIVPVLLRGHGGSGMWLLLWMFAIVWTTDCAAYFVGRALGGPKLWPAVSPKKTWSGFLGGLVGAVGMSLVLVAAAKDIRLSGLEMLALAAVSALASVASQGGDLAESAMKRHFGVKDSGRLIPGHGGFMDRLDGFAAVAILIALAFGPARLVFGAIGR